MSDLHAAIMNLPPKNGPLTVYGDTHVAYMAGHRDARHAAAELASEYAASHQRLKEALGAVLCMLPSDHEDRPAEERIPASYCYVRWQDIREAREALRSAP